METSAGTRMFAGVLRAHRRKGEWTAADVLAFAPDPAPAERTVYDRLEELEALGVVESKQDPADGRRRLWTLVLDPGQAEIPTEERML